MFVDRGTMLLLPVLLALFASFWTPTGARVIQKRAAFYIANDTMCIVDGDVFYNGDPVPTDDECERCTCRPPGFSCVLRDCDTKPGCKAVRRAGECCPEYVCGCVHNNRVYEDGEVIRDLQNACYTCRCHGSSISCTFAECLFRGDCPPEYVQGECCPRYDHCPPLRTTSTTVPSTVFTTESSTHPHIIQQEEQFFNLTTQHLEKFTDEDITVRVEDVQHSSTSSFTTVAYGTSTLPTVTVKFTLTDGPVTSIADFDITTLSSVLPLQTATYTESTRYALPDEAHGGLSTTQESSSFADYTTSPSSVDVVTDSSTIDRYASSSAIEDVSSESSTIDYSAPSTTQPEVSTESSVNIDVSTPLPTKDLSESTTAHYEASSSSSSSVSSESSFISFDTSSPSTASDSAESTTTYYDTSSSSSLGASSDSSFNDSDAYSSSTTSDTSETTTATYETTSSGISRVSSEKISIDYDTSTFTAASASSEDTVVDYKVTSSTTLDDSSESSSTDYDAYTSTSVVVSSEDIVLNNKASSAEISDVSTDSFSINYDASTPTASSEHATVDNEASFSVASDASTESSAFYYDASTPSADPSFSEGTTIYYEEPSTTSSYSSESTTVAYETSSFSTTTIASSENFSTDENASSYSFPDVSSESSAIDYDSNSSFTSDVSSGDPAVDNEASSTFTPKISSENDEFVSTTTVTPIDKISVFETHTDLQTEGSFDVRGVSADKYTPSVTESFLNYTSTEVDVSTEYSANSTTHSTALISEDNETKVIQESEVTSTFSSDDEFQPSSVEEKIKWSNNEYNLTDDLTESQFNETASAPDVDESSFSTIVPYTEEINITETHSSTTHTNPEVSTSTEHVTDVSSAITVTESHSSVATFYYEDELSTVKPTAFSEIDSTTQESIKASSTDDEIINAKSDQASKIEILSDSITTASNASEELPANYTNELLESSGYTGYHSSFGIDKETFTTEQLSEIPDVKSITESPAISETSTYDEPQTTDQSLYSTSEDTIIAEHYTSTESSDKTTESLPSITTVKSNALSEYGIVTHVSFQTNALTTQEYPDKDNIGESTTTEMIENFDSKTTENIHKYSPELPSTEIVNEFSSVSETTETSSSKSVNELPATVSAEDFSLEHSLSSSTAVEFNDRNETTTEYPEDASTEAAQSIDVTQIPNKNDVDELILSNNESDNLNISPYFEESSSIQPEGTDDSLDVKTSSFPEQSISTSTISQNISTEQQFEDGTTNFNEINPINGTEEIVSNESIVKPLVGYDVNLIQSTTTEFYTETTKTDVSEFTSTFKPTTEYDFNTTALSTENEGKNPLNDSFITPFANLVASELEEILNKHFNLSRNPLAPHTNRPNNLEESNASETPDFENNADYIKVSTTERFDDSTHYTTEGQTEDLEDSETSQLNSGTAVNEDLNEKTEIALITLHPLKTDLSGLLSVNNKQPQTTEMQSTTEETNENNLEDATQPFYGNQTEYESIETSTSEMDETESHVFHSNLKEVSNNASVDSLSPENLDNYTTPEELVNGNTENVYFDTHDFSFPLITSGIPGEGLFTKYAQFHDQKFSESTSLTNNLATEFTESEEDKQNVEETDENEKELNGTNQSTDFLYDVADAEVITSSDALNNNSTIEENSSVTLTENNEDISNETNAEYNDLDTEISSTTENDSSANVPHETALLNNEQEVNDSKFSQTNGTAINQVLASLTPDNSIVSEERNTTHQEFDDYSALDAEEDNTLVSQQVNSGSEKTFVSVANNATSEEEFKSSDSPAENRPLEDGEEFTKIGNSSLYSELLSTEDTASSAESIESVVTKEEIFSSPNIYHAEEHSINADVHATETTENTSLKSEFTENPITTYSPPKENNVEVELHTQVSDTIASSTYPTTTQNSEETQTSTTTTEDNFSTFFPQTYESTQISISPSQPIEDTILNIFPESVKIHSDLFQNPTIPDSDNGVDGSLNENTKLPSNLEQDYISKTSINIQEEEKVTEVNQLPKLATEESLPQTETVSLDSDEVTDSGKTTISEILKPQSTTADSGSVTDDHSNSELLTYNNHRGKEPELVSVQSSETTNTNHINILFGQTTDHFATSEKTQVDSVTPVSESQSQTEKNEPAETYFTIDENNYGIALHEIGDPQNIKPATVDSTSAVTTTDKNTATNSPDDDLYENEYDHEEATNDLNSKSQTGENSSTISYEKTESPEIVEVGSHTTPSQENFNVIGYLGDLFSGINVFSSPASTDITQTESINSSQEYPNDNRENTENPPVDPINAAESKPEQSIDAHFSSSAGTNTENIVTEIDNEEKSKVASSTENELQTEPNSDTQSTQEVFRDEIQESSYTTQKGLDATEDPIPKSYISSLNFSIEEEDSRNDNIQVSSNPHTSSDDNYTNDEWEGEFSSDSVDAEKPNSVSDNPDKPTESYETTNFISTTSELPNSSEKGPEKGGEPIIPSITPLKHESEEEEIPSNAHAEDVTENSKLSNDINYATTLASYVLYRGKDNETTINISEKIVSTKPNSNNNDDITFDNTEVKSTGVIPIESHESVTSVQDVNKPHQEIYYSNDGSFNTTDDYISTASENSSLNSELPEKFERNLTVGGIVNNTLKTQSFQPYSLFDVISNVFKAPGYDAEVHSTFLKEQADISKKEKPVGVVKRDTKQRGERQISEIYEAAISETKNLEPEPRRLQAQKFVSSEGFAFPNSNTQQQPAFASVTSSFIIVDRADDSSRSRRKIPIRNPGGEIQEIEVPASFTFPPSFRFPSRSATKNEKESHK